MTADDFYVRRAGILLHPTSLPSGVLDADADRWLEMLSEAGFGVWQVLPLGEPQSGLSPYQCISAFAINPALLRKYPAAEYNTEKFRKFCATNQWLKDYATFRLLHRHFDTAPWFNWPDKFRLRDPEALDQLRREHAQEFLHMLWQQFVLHNRWLQIKQYANSNGILLFGDMPLFVAHDSVDVWANPDQYLLDEKGMPTVVAGVPPDYYSSTGQRWGNPHYNWEVMQASDFAWWRQRMQNHLGMFDLVRIDHFRGLEAAWMINAGCETAVDGHWEKMPGAALLNALREDYGQLPIIAEDLGIITPEVTALRKQFHLPGMSVLQFGFDAHEDNPHKPHNIETDCVVYTGTHDNNTTRGWFEGLPQDEQQYVLNTLGIDVQHSSSATSSAPGKQVVSRLVERAMDCRASLCMIPLQDILQLDSSARMNTPGTIDGNWQWSFKWRQLDNNVIGAMRQQLVLAGRLTI
ncbi:MAG TPA: 4-alpha-glucanotransferase [Gammaproteobacteria bacterium]|jgi:4-alpha-glucanotransferase|nr:4-alpha-glucanotransferase [Gammaproteobacteria bacterium]